jgi:hypothetical protein
MVGYHLVVANFSVEVECHYFDEIMDYKKNDINKHGTQGQEGFRDERITESKAR